MSARPVTDAPPQRDLARITLAVLVIGLLTDQELDLAYRLEMDFDVGDSRVLWG